MVRVKLPYGGVTADQLELLGSIADRYSRGWAHLTTRQNVQFHFVQLERVPGPAARAGRGRAHHPRGVRRHRPQRDGLPPGRRLPLRGARHQPLGRGHLPPLPASPLRPAAAPQVQDQLLGLRHRLRPGHVQRRRRGRRRPPPTRTGRWSRASGSSWPAASAPTRTRPRRWRSSPPARTCCRRIEAILRTFDHFGNRDNKLRARLKWVVDQLGIDELRRRVLRERQLLLASSTWPGGIPAIVEELGDAPAGMATGADPTPVGTPVTFRVDTPPGPVPPLGVRQRRDRRGQGHGVGHRLRQARRHHVRPVPGRWPPSCGTSASTCG